MHPGEQRREQHDGEDAVPVFHQRPVRGRGKWEDLRHHQPQRRLRESHREPPDRQAHTHAHSPCDLPLTPSLTLPPGHLQGVLRLRRRRGPGGGGGQGGVRQRAVGQDEPQRQRESALQVSSVTGLLKRTTVPSAPQARQMSLNMFQCRQIGCSEISA